MKISACIITKNEEKNIARSILSYKDIVDEIIVVDSESTDDTVKIAESLGAKVYNRPWTNDFAAAKNFAIDKATGDWIIFLDADEYFACGQNDALHELFKEIDQEDVDTVLTPRYEIQDTEDHVIGKCYVERIFKCHPDLRYVNKVHECLLASGGTPKRHFAERLTIYHTGYDASGNLDKVKRNMEILSDPGTKLHDSKIQHFYLISSYFTLGMYKEVLKEFDLLLAVDDFRNSVIKRYNLFRVYIFMINSMLALEKEYGEESVMQAFRQIPAKLMRHPEIKYLQHVCFLRYQRIDEAIAALEEALKLHAIDDSGYENFFGNDIAHKYAVAANLYMLKNLTRRATELFVMALKENKNNGEYLNELLILMEDRETPEKQEVIENIYNVDEIADMYRIIMGTWISGCNDLFAIYFLQMLKRWPAEASDDKTILCRVFLMQKNYKGVIDLASQQPENKQLQQFALIASMVLNNPALPIGNGDFDFMSGVVLILLD